MRAMILEVRSYADGRGRLGLNYIASLRVILVLPLQTANTQSNKLLFEPLLLSCKHCGRCLALRPRRGNDAHPAERRTLSPNGWGTSLQEQRPDLSNKAQHPPRMHLKRARENGLFLPPSSYTFLFSLSPVSTPPSLLPARRPPPAAARRSDLIRNKSPTLSFPLSGSTVIINLGALDGPCPCLCKLERLLPHCTQGGLTSPRMSILSLPVARRSGDPWPVLEIPSNDPEGPSRDLGSRRCTTSEVGRGRIITLINLNV